MSRPAKNLPGVRRVRSARGASSRSTSTASRLQTELAVRILQLAQSRGAGPGHRLIELELSREFSVSRTPIRGALQLLESKGYVESQANHGFTLRKAVRRIDDLGNPPPRDENDRRLYVAIAEARMKGALPDECSQQELVRMFQQPVSVVVRVLRQLAELGLVERKSGHGWAFLSTVETAAAQRETYEFRLLLEPAAILQPGFKLDHAWAASMRQRHEAFAARAWRDTLAVEFFEMNAEFHGVLAASSGNRYITVAIEHQNRLRTFLNYAWRYGVERVRTSINEHLEILDALERNDRRAAAALMRRHLEDASRTVANASGDSTIVAKPR